MILMRTCKQLWCTGQGRNERDNVSQPSIERVELALRVLVHHLRRDNQPGEVAADACHAPDLRIWLRRELACWQFLQGGVHGVQYPWGHVNW